MKKIKGKTIKSQHYLYPGPLALVLSRILSLFPGGGGTEANAARLLLPAPPEASHSPCSNPARAKQEAAMERDVRQDELAGAQPLLWLRLWSAPPSRSPAIFFDPSHLSPGGCIPSYLSPSGCIETRFGAIYLLIAAKEIDLH
jgi:hypothetical protein